jgi:hypothetical protein
MPRRLALSNNSSKASKLQDVCSPEYSVPENHADGLIYEEANSYPRELYVSLPIMIATPRSHRPGEFTNLRLLSSFLHRDIMILIGIS